MSRKLAAIRAPRFELKLRGAAAAALLATGAAWALASPALAAERTISCSGSDTPTSATRVGIQFGGTQCQISNSFSFSFDAAVFAFTPSGADRYFFITANSADETLFENDFLTVNGVSGGFNSANQRFVQQDFSGSYSGEAQATRNGVSYRFNLGLTATGGVSIDLTSATVTIDDDAAPTLVEGPADIATPADPGESSAVVTYATPSFEDNHRVESVELIAGPASGAAFPLGATTVTYRATDFVGNSADHSFTVTVGGDQGPTLNLPGDIAVSTDPGLATAAVSWSASVDDDQPGATLTQTQGPAPGSAFPIGTTVIGYEAEDSDGNTASGSFTVTVADDEDPALLGLPGDISVAAPAGASSAPVSWTPPTASDNAPGASVLQTAGQAPGTEFPLGSTVISYEATDAAGNTASGSFTVTVVDGTPPEIVGLPGDIEVATDPDAATAQVSWAAPTVSDDQPGAVIEQTAGPAAGADFPIGETLITYTATDAAGNQTSASFAVRVADEQAPRLAGVPGDISLATDAGVATAVASWTPPTAQDNAPGATVAQTAGPAPGSAFAIGETTIAYTAADAAGNTASASFTVTVVDEEAPSLTGLPGDIAVAAAPGESGATVSWTPPTAADNVGATATQSAGPAPGSRFALGTTRIEYTAADAAGNSVSGGFDVTVTDAEAPQIVGLPSDVFTPTDAGEATARVSWREPTASDNDGATLAQIAGPASGSDFPIGTTVITYRAADSAGNETFGSFEVTVEDIEAPVVVGAPSDATVPAEAGRDTAAYSWTAPTAEDNAPGVSIAQTAGPAPGSAFALGETTVAYTATDAAGNTATASFTVTVVDDQAPVIENLPADIVASASPGKPTAFITWTEPTAADNAAGAVIAQTAGPPSGSDVPIGLHTVRYTATDAAGAETTASFTVTVTDDEAPSFDGATPDIAATTDPGAETATVSWTPPTASDNGPAPDVIQTKGLAPGSAFPIGETLIEYEARDAEGNTATTRFKVTVRDGEAPVFTDFPADIAVEVVAPTSSAVVSWTPPGVSDNTEGATVKRVSGPAPGSEFPLGATTVIYLAEDETGNSVKQALTVTVSQIDRGSVTFVVESEASGEYRFRSNAPEMTFTLKTNSTATHSVSVAPGRYSVAFTTPDGVGVQSARCTPSPSAIDAASKSGTISVAPGQETVCTIASVDVLEQTTRLIGQFIAVRADLILEGRDDADRRLNRIKGTDSVEGGVSGFGLSGLRERLPFGLSMEDGKAAFQFSLAAVRARMEAAERAKARALLGQAGAAPGAAVGEAADETVIAYGLAIDGGAETDQRSIGQRYGSPRFRQPFDVWVKGRYARFQSDDDEGDFYALQTGADWLLTDRVLIGVSGQFDWTSLEAGDGTGGEISGFGFLVGPYLTGRLHENLFMDLELGWGRSYNQISPFGGYEDDVDGQRWFGSAALIGDFASGPWTLRPELRASYFREETEAYRDSVGVSIPSLEVEKGTLSFAPRVGRRFVLENGVSATPNLGVKGIWTFAADSGAGASTTAGDLGAEEGWRARIAAGLDLARSGGFALTAGGFYDGLGDASFEAWGGSLRLSIPLGAP